MRQTKGITMNYAQSTGQTEVYKEKTLNFGPPKNVKRAVALFVACVLALSLYSAGPFSAKVSAAPGDMVLNVQQTFTNTGTLTVSGASFNYRIEPRVSTNPLPASGEYFNIQDVNGQASRDLTIAFTLSGKYYYDVYVVSVATTGYTLDMRVYTLEIYVMNDLTTYISIKDNSSGNKVPAIVFNHSYYGVRPVDPPVVPPVNLPVVPPVVPPGVVDPDPEDPTDPPVQQVDDIKEPRSVVVPNAPTTRTIQDEIMYDEDIPVLQIGNIMIPLHGGSQPSWALINLVLSIAGFVLGVLTLILVMIRRQQKHEDDTAEESSSSSTEDSSTTATKKRRFMWLVITLILAVVGILLFFLIEDMTLPMVLLNWWTILFAFILLMEIVSMTGALKRKTKQDDEKRSFGQRDSRYPTP